jgi:hypothetical protein
MQERQNWLEITDSEVTSAELVAEIERRVDKRRLELGKVRLQVPSFAPLSTYPEPPYDRDFNQALYYHLRRANQVDSGKIEPLLGNTTAMRIPVLGRLLRSARRRIHELVLFYVNRAVIDEKKLDKSIVCTLNELTRVIQEQQEEIDKLKAERRSFEEEQR